MHNKLICATATAAVLALMAAPGPASAQWVKAGLLACDVSGGWGWIVGSAKSVTCVFTPDVPGPQETYAGVIRKFGLDIGATDQQSMVWGVFSPTSFGGHGALAGDYAGASGQATVAVGLGANVLIGGSNNTVALQPLSVSGQTGLNLAVGVADLELRPAR